MGLFGNIFGSNSAKEQKELPWIPLNTLKQLESIKENSRSRPQFIFKHSTTCGISRMVLGMFSQNYPFTANQADLYYLDLKVFREISNKVAEEFQVIHQSPQLIVIKNEAVLYHTSHGSISETNLEQFT